eukprot:TRINITY_DN543_c0_g1_i1.p1 TRINITY_DN543_c0_g1~~TRINITY_DN543_c0_g1_i1.p1  ORF type:complete len:1398 (-),score=629.24 TRINITY_DN543_c0_g1_i1:161-4354(-)
MDGWLVKRPQFSSSTWRKYYYRINGHSLREYREAKANAKHRKSFKLKSCVLNAGASVSSQAGKPNSFALVPENGEPVFFSASDAKALEAWAFALSKLVKSVNKEGMDIQSFSHAVVTADTNGQVKDANKSFLSLLGYSIAEVTGKNVTMFMPKVLRPSHASYIEHYLRTGEKRLIGKPRKVKAVHKDGSYIAVLLCLDEYFEGKDRFFVANFCVNDSEQARAGFSGLTAKEMEFDDDDEDESGSDRSASSSSTVSRAPQAPRIHSGVLKKRTMFGRWKASWYVATREHLAEYSSEKSTKPRARYAYKGMRLGTDASSMMGKANCFSITPSDGDTYFFQAASDADMSAWTEALAKFVESQNTTMDVEWFKSATVCSDTVGKIIAVNTNAEVFFGYDRAEMLGKNVTMFMPDEIAQHHAGFLKRYLKTGQRRLMGKPRQFTVILKGKKEKTTLLCIGEYFENGERKFMANFCTSEEDLEQAGFDLEATEVAKDKNRLPAIKSGWLTSKTTFGKWKKRHCMIQSDMLILCKEENGESVLELDITESVIGVDASGFTNKPFCFSVTPSGSETIFFRCKSDDERAEWTDALAAFAEASATDTDLGRIDAAAIMSDETGKILALNPRAEDMFGYTKAELIGRNVSLLTPKVIARQHASFIQRYLDTGVRRLIGKPRVVNAVHNDKSTVRVRINLGEVFENDQRRFLAQFELDNDELKKRKLEGADSDDSDASEDSGSGSASSSGLSSDSHASQQMTVILQHPVMKEGSLRSKPLFGRWAKGYFVIRGSTLLEYESKAKTGEAPLNHSDIAKCNVADACATCNRPWCFSLTMPGRDARYFQAGSDAQMKEWMEVFEAFANSGGGGHHDLESYPYASVVTDEECKILAVNKKLTKLLGFTKEECKGSNVTMFMPKSISIAHAGYVNRYNKTRKARLMGKPRRLKAVHKTGMFVDVLVCLSEVKDKHGNRRFMGHLKVDADEELGDDDDDDTMADAMSFVDDDDDLGRTPSRTRDTGPAVGRRFMKTPPAGGRKSQRARSSANMGTVQLAAAFKSGIQNSIESAVNREFAVVLEKINELESQKKALAEEIQALKGGAERKGSQGEMVTPAGGKKKKKGSLASLFKFNLQKDEEVHLVINEKLAPGGGSSAGVYSCTVNGWVCAMKELVIPQNSVGAVESFEKEITLLESLPMHPNIARYLFHQQDGDRLRLFITRYAGTLSDVIEKRERKGEPFTLPEIARFLLDVVRGLHFLHQNKIMHRDLKSDNVFTMLNEQGHVQQLAIGDFDQSRAVNQNQAMTCVGTPGYIAPEVLTGAGGGYGFAADVWSVGMLAYELLTLKRPYHNLRGVSDINRASMTGTRPKLPDDIDKQFQPIIDLHLACTEREPSKRPPLLEIKNALVVASVPW